jgi:hypothetical protein
MSDITPKGADEQDYWLDKPTSVNLIIKTLIVACVIVVLADFGYHKHGDFHFREWFAFDAIFGFSAYVFLILCAKGWRKLVMRREDYYD